MEDKEVKRVLEINFSMCESGVEARACVCAECLKELEDAALLPAAGKLGKGTCDLHPENIEFIFVEDGIVFTRKSIQELIQNGERVIPKFNFPEFAPDHERLGRRLLEGDTIVMVPFQEIEE